MTLEWSPNTEPDLAGYTLFCREQGQNYDYTNPCWEGTDTACTIYDLDETKTYFFVVRAVDTEGFQSSDSNETFLEAGTTPDNQPPIADAGPNQTVNEGQLVGLDGSNSFDSDDGIAFYNWVQTSGPQVTLSDPNAKQSTFTAPDVDAGGDSLTFELTVTDHNGFQSADSCVVNVTWLNEPPQANAGLDQTVTEGTVVTLDGSSSLDIDDGIVSCFWNQIGGPGVTLSNPASSQPTFTAPNVEPDGVSLTFNLTVTDAGGLKSEDSCIVNISWQNQPPTAAIAPDYRESVEGTVVTLDGSVSTDSDDGIASHLWTQIEGDPVSISDPTSAVMSFTAPKADLNGNNLKFKLTVKDFGGLQGTADGSVYVRQNELPNNLPPAAAFSVVFSRKVALFTDNSSDTDGAIVSWLWNFGDGKTGTEQNPEHRYNKFGNYSVTLTVTDDRGLSNSISKNITIGK
ncbi:MAG: PKD domain-containing protein [Deltaproteobacteria bacterium]|nr:PKD domain-containing protein [Deltaproteobacteria bacterium]